MPDPTEFWKYLEASAPAAPAAPAPPADTAALRPPPRTAPEDKKGGLPKLPGSRQEFESWLGGVLFPQRAKKQAQPEVAAGAPYGRLHTPTAPPPVPTRRVVRPAQHTTGSAGGSQFAARRQQAAAAPAAPARAAPAAPTGAGAPQSNITLGLDPYEPAAAVAAPADASAHVVAAPGSKAESKPGNPLAGFMQAVGQKAQHDIQATMEAAGKMAENLGQPPKVEPSVAEGSTAPASASGAYPAVKAPAMPPRALPLPLARSAPAAARIRKTVGRVPD